MQSSIESVNAGINGLQNQLTQQEAQKIALDLAALIGKVYVNLDITRAADYSNDLMGKLIQPLEVVHPTLVGKAGLFSDSSIPSLSVNSLPARVVLSNGLKYEFLRSLPNRMDNLYVSPFMNSTQIMATMFSSATIGEVNNCDTFYSFYREFNQTANYTLGMFTFEVENCSVVLAMSKADCRCVMYTFGEVPLFTDLKLSHILTSLDYSVQRCFSPSNSEVLVLQLLQHLVVHNTTRCENPLASEAIPVDTLVTLVDGEYKHVNHVLYTSTTTALLLLKVKQYVPADEQQARIMTISGDEMKQIFSVGYTLQKNIQALHMLKDTTVFEGLVAAYAKSKDALCAAIKSEFVKHTNLELEKLVAPFLTGALLRMAECPSAFHTELSVTRDALSWWKGTEYSNNDRNGYHQWGINEFHGGHFNSYESAVRESANAIRKAHLEYVERSKVELRDGKRNPAIAFTTKGRNEVVFNKPFIHQLPFFVLPLHATSFTPVLPLFEELRTSIARESMRSSFLLTFDEFVQLGLGYYKLFYEVVGTHFQLHWFFVVNNLADKPVPAGAAQLGKDAILKANGLVHLATSQRVTYSSINNGVALTAADAIWTFFCGGVTANGQSSAKIREWSSHIPGNNGAAHINVPAGAHRDSSVLTTPNLAALGAFERCAASTGNTEACLCHLYAEALRVKYEFAASQVFATGQPVAPLLSTYLSTVRAIETYDHFTYQQLRREDINIRSREDVTNKLLAATMGGQCCSILAQFNAVDCVAIQKRYKTAMFVGTEMLSACLKEVSMITEQFAPFVVNGKSYLTVHKDMLDLTARMFNRVRNLALEWEQSSHLSAEERVAKMDAAMLSMKTQLLLASGGNPLLLRDACHEL